MAHTTRAVIRQACYALLALTFYVPVNATAQSLTPPIVVEPETIATNFGTDTFIPDFLGPGFITLSSNRTFEFSFEVPAGEEGLYQIQVRHASNNSISILVDGTPVTPDLALSTRTLGFWFDNEAYTTLTAGPHTISFGGPVFLDTFRISRTPPDANRFLTYPTSVNEIFFGGSEENSIAYYNTIDPNGQRTTLSDFRELNGFTLGGFDIYNEFDPEFTANQEALNGTDFSHAVYQNIADLDLGRNMYVLKFSNGDVASYVQNFATPDNALDRRNILATVAMEYRADERLTTFYAYDGGGRRVTKVDLDGRGQKFVPTLCAACHGGKPKDDIDGVYQNGGNIGSKWIAWDIENFEFSDRLQLEEQESAFRSMNQAVLCTTPSVSNAELIRGWYSADTSANCTNPLPEVSFDGEYVPDGWNDTPGHRDLYLDVVRPSCRSCHAQRGTYSDNTLLERKRELEFSTFEHFELYKDEIERHVFDQATMPSALVTYEAFWRSRGSAVDQPEILDRELFGGEAHISAPESVYPAEAQAIYGPRRQPGRPIARVAETDTVTNGVEGRLNALPSDFAANTTWSVTGGDFLPGLPSNESLLTVDPDGRHEVTLSVSNFDQTYTDSATVTIESDPDQRPSSVLFDPDIKNLLQSSTAGLSCTSCHQPGGRANTVYHFAEPADFIGSLTPEQFAYTQALTRVDCRDPESSLLLRRPSNPNHFGGALFREGDNRWNLLRRWIAEGAPFDENRTFTEPGSDCGVLIEDPDYQPAETASDSGIQAEYPRLITLNNDSSTVWVEFADNTKQFVNSSCRQQLLDNNFDEINITSTEFATIPDSAGFLSCDAIANLPRQLINSVPEPVQPGLDLHIREFAVIPDNTQFGVLRVKPGLLSMTHQDGRLFVVEQHEGKIWEITDGVVASEPWLDVHQAFINATGEGISVENLFHGGLRAVAFHPEFASNGKIYTSQMRIRPDDIEGIHYLSDTAAFNVFTDSTVSEWTVDSDGNVLSHRELFRIGYSAEDHLIKQLTFNPYATPGSEDFGLLYIGHGDGTLGDFFGSGQQDDGLGKILRIDPLANGDEPYSIPASNPFTGDDSWETDEVYAMGFRNPHHISFARDGTTMVVDVGRANIEEVNVIGAGSNHGWPDREGSFTHLKEQGGGFLTGIGPLPADDADFGFTYPAAQYGHVGSYGNPFTGHSIAGGYVVENGSDWDGQYLYGDFVSFGDVYHTSLQGLKDAVTRGAPESLTRSVTRRARVLFDNDNNPTTEDIVYDTMLGVINDSPRYFSHSGSRRADIRFGQGPGGEIFIMNKRNNTVYLVTNSLGEDSSIGNGNVQTANSAPVFNGNLRHQVYTDTTAELFWDRATDEGFVQGYEIIRNGELLGVFDALSKFEDDLDPAIVYTYEITAVDTDGNRSDTLTLVLSTTGVVPEGPVTSNPSTGEAPVFIGNLRHAVYTDTSAELFWDRATDDGFIQGYEIIRNGELQGVFDALSKFEDDLDPAIVYTYEITAVDTDGNRSQTRALVFATREDAIAPTEPAPTEPAASGIAPDFPGNISHQVYSDTSLELFWERATDDGFIAGYEITRNGETLGLFDALSLFEGALDPSITYNYEITAIDTDGNRSTTASTTLSTRPENITNSPAPASPASSSAPQFVGNLRQTTYSSTSAELFWDRATDDGFIQGYEIVRNSESLGVRDALSLFEGQLDPSTTYTYAITALDTDGNRSTTQTITFSTGTGGTDDGNNGVTTPSPSGSGPDFAANLRHQVYSGTTAEIFWDRATHNDLVQGYEIIRNGEFLGVRDALSLFEGSLDPSVTYTYQITALDLAGNRSATATLTLSTGSNTDGSGDGNSQSGGPNFNANLRHQVYSNTSAEIFWDRATHDNLVQGYEIIRNGSSLGVRDTLSVFEGDLDPNVSYTYQITAIDIVGNRSATASITLSTSN